MLALPTPLSLVPSLYWGDVKSARFSRDTCAKRPRQWRPFLLNWHSHIRLATVHEVHFRYMVDGRVAVPRVIDLILANREWALVAEWC